MNKNKITPIIKHSLISLVFVTGVGFSAAASAVSIDFDTRQNGVPYVGLSASFPANEYNGVEIRDSDPTPGSTFVNLINPVNVGTAISGYYVNVGAFAATPQTQLTLDFTPVATEVSFDFATPSGDLTVSAFDVSGALLGMFNFLGTDVFVNQAGFDQLAGHADISGIGNIATILVEPDINQALIFDNLNFTPVPIPAAFWLFGSGLIGLLGFVRYRS